MLLAFVNVLALSGEMAVSRLVGPHPAFGHGTVATTALSLLWDEPFLLDTSRLYVPSESACGPPAVSAVAGQYLVVWQDRRYGRWDLLGARVAQTGDLLDTSGIVLAQSLGRQVAPTATSNGGYHLVVWEDSGRTALWNVYATAVDTAGRVLSPGGFPILLSNRDKHSPDAVPSGGRFLVVWDEYFGSRNVAGALVDTAGNVQGPIDIAVGPGWQAEPAIAAGDSGYLVAWVDDRNRGLSQVYCAGLDTAGRLRDTAGIYLAPDGYGQQLPAVASDGTDYLVVWEETALTDSDIYGIRVSHDGVVLDSVAIRIGTAPGRQRHPRVVYKGGEYLVFWDDARNQASAEDIYGAHVSRAGVVREPAGFGLIQAYGVQQHPAVACTDTQALLVWKDERADTLRPTVFGSRLDLSDSVLDPEGLALAGSSPYYLSQSSPAIACSDWNYFAAWTGYLGDSTAASIYGIRVSSMGSPLDRAATPICHDPGAQDSVAVAAGPNGYLVAWVDRRPSVGGLYCARVSAEGVLVDTAGIRVGSDSTAPPSLSYGDSCYLIAWATVTGSRPIYGARVSMDGVVSPPGGFRVSRAGQYAASPSSAYAGNEFLVAWSAFTAHNQYDILGTRISASGQVVDTNCFVVGSRPGRDYRPVVASDGWDYMVSWWSDNNSGNVYGARVTHAGVTLDSAGFNIAASIRAEKSPTIAFDGNRYCVAWQSLENNVWRIRGANIETNGVVTDTFLLAAESADCLSPALARGPWHQQMLVYSARAESIGGIAAGVTRIWGKLSGPAGVSEDRGLTRIWSDALTVGPNPFNRLTLVHVPPAGRSARAYLDIRDVAGRRVARLPTRGRRTFSWDGTDSNGRRLAPGVYFFQTGAGNAVARVILLP
jgi:hypothetical protein